MKTKNKTRKPAWVMKLKNLSPLNKNPDKTKTQIMIDSGLSYQTVISLSNNPETTKFKTLPSYLIAGLGMSPEDVADLRLGDLFEIGPN